MNKLDFIYIGKEKNRLPKNSFNALRLSKKDKETFCYFHHLEMTDDDILFPQTNTFCDENKVFIRGIGEKKFGKTNKVEVPVFSGNLDEWDEYLAKYGRWCLFYSISGYSLDDADCCAYKAIEEFLSLLQCKGGIKHYQEYVKTIKKIQGIQIEVIKEKFSQYCSDWEINNLCEKYIVQPDMRLGLLITPPYLNTLRDDDMLEIIYEKIRRYEIDKTNPLVADYKKIVEEKQQEYQTHHESCRYYNLCDKATKLHTRIINDSLKQINQEIQTGVFPVSTKERLRFLYGDECAKLYEEILINFKD